MIFVTGASGLVGSHLAFELVKQGKQVCCLVRENASQLLVRQVFTFLDPQSGKEMYDRLLWVWGDVLDPESLLEGLEGCDTLIHSAGVVSYHRKDRAHMYRVNVGGTANILEVAARKGITRVAHISSIAALGRPSDDKVVRESDRWYDADSHTHYGISKHLGELEVYRAVEEGLNAFIVNPGVVLGAGEKGRSSNALVSILDRGLPFYSAGQTGVTGAGDLARYVVSLLDTATSGERYICVNTNLSFEYLCQLICRELGRPAPKSQAPGWLLTLAVLGHGIREFFTGRRAVITRESVITTGLDVRYDNSKILQTTGLEFASINAAIHEAALFHRTVTSGL